MLRAAVAATGAFVVVGVVVLFGPGVGTSLAASQVATVGCDGQSEASFPGAFSHRANLVVGPLVFSGLRDIRSASPDDITEHDGWKSQALLRPGHTVRVSVDRRARSVARLDYAPDRGFRPAFDELPHTIRFRACSARRADSDADGRPVTFWSGFLRLSRAPACVPITFKIDRSPSRHRRLRVAGGRCPESITAARSSASPARDAGGRRSVAMVIGAAAAVASGALALASARTRRRRHA